MISRKLFGISVIEIAINKPETFFMTILEELDSLELVHFRKLGFLFFRFEQKQTSKLANLESEMKKYLQTKSVATADSSPIFRIFSTNPSIESHFH